MAHELLDEWKGSRFPEGGYPYVDGKTGKNFDATSGDLSFRVLQVQEHRRANPHIYTDHHELDSGYIRQQIIDFMCSRRPHLCVGGQQTQAVPLSTPEKPVPSSPCPKCGQRDAKPTYCQSCGGNRISSWACNNCGTKF